MAFHNYGVLVSDQHRYKASKGCEEKHFHTAAHHPVVKPPSVVSTAVSHIPTQQQDRGNY